MDLTEDIHGAVHQKRIQAANMSRLLARAEAEAQEGSTRSAREFLNEFKRDRAMQE